MKNICKQAEERENHEFKFRSCLRKIIIRENRHLKRSAIKSDSKERRQSLTKFKNNIVSYVSRSIVKRRLEKTLIKK